MIGKGLTTSEWKYNIKLRMLLSMTIKKRGDNENDVLVLGTIGFFISRT